MKKLYKARDDRKLCGVCALVMPEEEDVIKVIKGKKKNEK